MTVDVFAFLAILLAPLLAAAETPDTTADAAPPPSEIGTEQAAGETIQAPQHRAVARAGDQLIRLSDLYYWARKNPNYLKNLATGLGRNEVLNQIIKSSLLAAAAEERFGDDTALDSESLSNKVTKYRIRFLTPSSDVPEDELRAYYRAHVAELGIPPMVRVRELFFPKSPDESVEAARSAAEAAKADLQAGVPLKELALEHAPDYPSRRAGGDRGFLSVVERALLGELTADMSPGDISEPVELIDGFSIVQLVDRRAGVPAEFDDVKDAVKRRLLAKREAELLARFFATESATRGVEILLPEFADAWPHAATVSEPVPQPE